MENPESTTETVKGVSIMGGHIYVIADGALATGAMRPTWASGTDYVVGDKASVGAVDYNCIRAHTSANG